jgi:hypothetical protein
MTITVEIKSVYGNRTIYPVCKTAKAFAAISGNKTLTSDVISIIQAMGYAINVQAPTL